MNNNSDQPQTDGHTDMRLAKNIDGRGRLIRGASGAAFLAIATIVLLRGFKIGGQTGRWSIIAVAGAAGAFQVFEALTGWCVVRALGFRTPV